jgi:hypothetical protein
LRRILRTIEAAQVLWGLRKAPAFATAIELLKADPLLTLAELPLDVRQRAQAWFDARGIDVSDLNGTTPVWVVVRRVCDVLVTQSSYGETDPTDDFTRADESPLSGGGNWGSGTGAWGDLKITSNQATTVTPAVESAARWEANDFSLDHFSEATIGNFVDGLIAATTRMRTDADGDCYSWEADVGTSALALFRFDDSAGLTPVQLGSDVSELAATDDVMRLESSGTTHTGKRNGTQKIQQTDATYNAGGTHIRLGIRVFCPSTNGDAKIKFWQGADLVPPAPTITLQPQSKAVVVGATATFSVEATASPGG